MAKCDVCQRDIKTAKTAHTCCDSICCQRCAQESKKMQETQGLEPACPVCHAKWKIEWNFLDYFVLTVGAIAVLCWAGIATLVSSKTFDTWSRTAETIQAGGKISEDEQGDLHFNIFLSIVLWSPIVYWGSAFALMAMFCPNES